MSSVSAPQPAWLRFPFFAVVAVAVVFAADWLTTIDGGTRAGLRVVVVVAAVVVAGTFYQRWSTVPTRAVPHHAMAAASLVGGALVVSAAFDAGAGVFGNQITAALGLAGLWVAVVAAHTSLSTPTGAGR